MTRLQHRREAARLRTLIAAATTPWARQYLEEQALQSEKLARGRSTSGRGLKTGSLSARAGETALGSRHTRESPGTLPRPLEAEQRYRTRGTRRRVIDW